MKSRFSTVFICLGLLTISLPAASGPACAALGEGVDSIAKDRKTLRAVKRPLSKRAHYTIEHMVSDANEVREFFTPSGVVFAIAWNGLVPPDLTPLLGSYAAEYRDAKQQLPRRHGQRRTQVKTDRVVVETWGHMRNLHGRAYAPALVPEGVNLDEIK